MELTHLALSQLSVSAANMRAGRRLPDVTDLIPTIRARGVLTPLLVRAGGGEDDRFEIVAGRRRYHAALAIAEEGGEAPLLPCAIMAEGDDADALEASIIENSARTDPDEVTQWVSFTRLIKEGRSVSQIAATFGMEEAQVRRVLALGNLNPRIRDLYAKQEIDAHTVRQLTMATKAKQAEWLALYRDDDAWAPTGTQLKHWLCGGQSIPTTAARFDIATYPDPIVTDLFGDVCYFGNAESFWQLQGEAIANLRQAYLDQGWSDVVIIEQGKPFLRWEHERVAKSKGGKVFVTVSQQGEVETREGWLATREARKRERTEQMAQVAPTQRAELTSTLRGYCDLHRHAMVQAALVHRPDVALRLIAAHAIAGSWLWSVKPDKLRAQSEAIAGSHAGCAARKRFSVARDQALGLMGVDHGPDTFTGNCGSELVELFERLLVLSDTEVLSILTVVMAETLAAGSDAIDTAGRELAIDPIAEWQSDDTFLALLRQRQVLLSLIGEVAGEAVASSNAHEKVKTLRGILGDCLAGTNGRTKAEPWAPRWLRFPAASYFDGSDDAEGTGHDAATDIADAGSASTIAEAA